MSEFSEGRSRWPHTLLRLYPRAWRDRYGDEFLALLQTRPLGIRRSVNTIASALNEHARALIETLPLIVRTTCYLGLTVPCAYALAIAAFRWFQLEASWLGFAASDLKAFSLPLNVLAVAVTIIAQLTVSDRNHGVLESTVWRSVAYSWALAFIAMPLAVASHRVVPTSIPIDGLRDFRALALINLSMATTVLAFHSVGIQSPVRLPRTIPRTSVLGLR